MENAEYVCCVMKIKEKEIVMELDQIMKMLKGKIEIKLVKFVSDKGPNSCEDCLKHHGEVFQLDDPEKPELPIHPNCRCKYELLTQDDIISTQETEQDKQKKLLTDVSITTNEKELLETIKEYAKIHTEEAKTYPRVTANGLSEFQSATVRVDDSPGIGGIRISGIDDMLDKLEKKFVPGSISILAISNHGTSPGRFPMGNSDDLIYLSAQQQRRLKKLLAPVAIIDLRMCYSSESSTGNKAAQKIADQLGVLVRGYEGPVSPYGTRANYVKPDGIHKKSYIERIFPDHRPKIFYPQKHYLK